MKNLIVYSSKSGNTRKLAEAVFNFLPGENVLKSVAERPDPGKYDFVVIGFWLQAGKADPESYEYLEKLTECYAGSKGVSCHKSILWGF